MLANKIPLSILGMIIPFAAVSVVYQFRLRLSPGTYKLGVMFGLATIALVPASLVFLQFSPALSVGDCVEDRRRTSEIELDSGKKITVPLMYKITAISSERYEMKGNDKTLLKVRFNKVDLHHSYKARTSCPGIE